MTYPAGSSYDPSGYGYSPAPSTGFDFAWISEAWALFRRNPWEWVTVMLGLIVVTLVLEFVFLGAMFSALMKATTNPRAFAPGQVPPFTHGPTYWIGIVVVAVFQQAAMAGMFRMAYRSARGEKVSAFDVVSIADVFGSVIGYAVLQLIFQLGPAFFGQAIMPDHLVIGIVMILSWWPIQLFMIFAPLAIVVEKANPLQAIARSFELVRRQWLIAMAFLFVLGLVSMSGALLCCVGWFATYPLYFLTLAVGFLRMPGPAAVLEAPSPGMWPPPPGSGASFGQPSGTYESPHTPQPPYGQAPAQRPAQAPGGGVPVWPEQTPPPPAWPSPPQPPGPESTDDGSSPGAGHTPREPRPPLLPGS